MIKSLRTTALITWVLFNIWSKWAMGTASVAQFSIEMEAHTLRVLSLAASALKDQEFLNKFPEFKALTGFDEIKKVFHAISAHDKAKQDDDILHDLVRFHGVRCGSLPDLAKTECLSAIDRLNARDTQYMNKALKEVGYISTDGSLSPKAKLVQSLEKAVDWGDRYWASAGEVSKEFGTTMEKGSEFVDSKILPKLMGADRELVQKSSDILKHFENSSHFNFAEITKGFSGGELQILRNNLGRAQLPISQMQQHVRSDLATRHNFGRGLRGSFAKWMAIDKPKRYATSKNVIKGTSKALGKIAGLLAVVPAVTEVVLDDANYYDALVRNTLPGTDSGISDLSSLYKAGNGNFENLKLLSLSERNQIYSSQESFYKLRERFSKHMPFVKRISCATNGSKKHEVELDFGKETGTHRMQMWKNERYGMYEFLDILPEDRSNIPVERGDLVREAVKVDECCRRSIRCAKKVNAIATNLEPKRLPSGLKLPQLMSVGLR
jgi:hypothetical protein